MKDQRILSGVRPTGHIHLGNYLGAIRQWVHLSSSLSQHSSNEQLFCIVDQHALTTPTDTKDLASNTHTIAAAYIACGINPDENTIFIQSHVPAHTELAWYLSCIAPLGWLNRMTQFKDKAGKDTGQAHLGLYAYPVLMAADILIYRATQVPVGEDQKQHVELARDLAGLFNRHCGTDYFPLPEPFINKATARIMSLRDGSKKMSKSDLSDYSRLHLTDDNDLLALKIRKAKTDSDPIPDNVKDLENRLEALNLLGIYANLTEQSLQAVCQQFAGQFFSAFKPILTDAVIATLQPIREKIFQLKDEKTYLQQILHKGSETANRLSQRHLREIRSLLGLVEC
ncbi:tryptophan--tRNA ligase [Candidatus Finniella inopinata]|uniref:Tryptophan--tRNA ligase n=1 Tax=Candidatus Finniella inopinata TaxID=1696036 RepID=A0A4Q7DPG2_9PROT|nr:tryptophan--tRNA ligase [Candidatus Finniella inopinata]RZI46886.1 tryptophan--tRNA ligase [Candidatus Finniella inopinata]